MMNSTHRRLLQAVILAAFMAVAASAVTLGQDTENVIISDTLSPRRIEVPAGTVVTWRNRDDERHRVRSRQGPVEFDSGNLDPGERFSVTFVVAGEYPYLDERNDDDEAYFGIVVVRTEQPADGPPPTVATVTLIDESFQPPTIEVAVGATVTWENIDADDDHTVTSTEGLFNSGILPAGSAFEHSFEAPGAYPYFCAIHPEMEGTITVIGDATAPTVEPVTESPGPIETGEPVVDVTTTAPQVSIIDVAFLPADIAVPAGTTVQWINDDPFAHTVTAANRGFDSGTMPSAAVFSHTFDEEGRFEYFCAIHPSMTATVTVTPVAGS